MKENILIVRFMGAEIVTEPVYITTFDASPAFTCLYYKLDGVVYSESELKYSTSWDWLMPVVEKIAKLCLETDWGSPKKLDEMLEVWNSLSYEISGVPKIDKVYNQAVEFIKWYNKENNNGKI